VGALQAIKHAGLRAGYDVSVIGSDDLPLAAYTDPPLTTLAQPFERAAARMVEMLLALMSGANPADFAELLPSRLIVRSSDGPAPASAAETRVAPQNQLGEIYDSQSFPRG
jgi:LacI family transcriptional regulator